MDRRREEERVSSALFLSLLHFHLEAWNPRTRREIERVEEYELTSFRYLRGAGSSVDATPYVPPNRLMTLLRQAAAWQVYFSRYHPKVLPTIHTYVCYFPDLFSFLLDQSTRRRDETERNADFDASFNLCWPGFCTITHPSSSQINSRIRIGIIRRTSRL